MTPIDPEYSVLLDSRYGEQGCDCPECEAPTSQQDFDVQKEVVTDAESLEGYVIWYVTCTECEYEYDVKDWRPEEEVVRWIAAQAVKS
jgi:hypothetical protein